MAAYDYIAIDGHGKKRKGIQEADSARQVRQQLRDKGLFVQSVDLSQKNQRGSQSNIKGGLFSPSLSVSELSLVTRQLATLIGSGMPLEECLKAAADQTEKQKTRGLILSVRAKVLEGFSLAAALKEYPKAFPVLYQATINAGEHSGHLDKVMDRLADYLEEQQQIVQKIQTASVYPVILVLVSIAIVIFLLTTIVPEIVSTIVSTGAELPRPTTILLSISEFLQNYWIHSGLVILFAIIGWVWFNHTAERKIKTHRLYLKLPLIRRISKGFNTGRYIGTVAMLTSSGTPLVEAMSISSQVVSNLEIQTKIKKAAVSVSEGSSLYKALNEAGYFRPMMLHMISSGEASGELDAMLEKTAEAEDRAVQNLLTTLMSLLEPVLLVVMGGIVLFIVMAVMLPMMDMNNIS